MKGRLAAALAAAAVVAGGPRAAAYDGDLDADRAYPAWLAPRPTEPLPGWFSPSNIAYEVRPGGLHEAEVHFRNISSETWHFDFWFPGWQEPGDNGRVRLDPVLEGGREVRLRVRLRSGRPALSSSRMHLFRLRRGPADEGTVRAAAGVAPPAPVPGEAWMPVRPVADEAVVRRANLLARVAPEEGGAAVDFLNPSPRDLHFRFAVPGLAGGRARADRVSVRAGGRTSVRVEGGASLLPPSLLRVVVSDLRVGTDAGPFFAVDPAADAGWYPVATTDGSAEIPRGRLLARVAPAGGDGARVRFRSRMRTPVRLVFRIPGWQEPGRRNAPLTVEPSGEAEVVVPLDRAPSGRISIARIEAFEVSHRDDE